jgi:hypothetical protein
VDGVWRGRGLSRRAFAILSEKIWLWCHSEHTSPGTRSVHRQLPTLLLLWQPSQSTEEAAGRCPCFAWKLC